MINLPSSYFEARHFGDVVSRFCSQDTILQAITTYVVEALLDGLLVSVTLVIMFLFAPTLTLIAIAGALLYGLLRWVSYTPLRHASAEAIVWGARRDSHVLETLRGVKTIKLFNGQDSRRAHWMNLLIEATNPGPCRNSSCLCALPTRCWLARSPSWWYGWGQIWCSRSRCRSACCSPSSPTRTSSSAAPASW
jgi:ABC-type multidrug transport system fused ATPase/permease subunit